MHTVLPTVQTSPTTANTFAVKETSFPLMGNSGILVIVASLNAVVATGNDHCTVCYELYSVMKQMANEKNEYCI
jgi:hypothetical protein